MAWNPSYAGYGLTDANGITIQRHRDHGPTRIRLDNLVTGGSVASTLAVTGRRVSATMRVRADDASGLQARLEALLAVLHRQDAADLVLDDTRKIAAFCDPGEVEVIKGSAGVYTELKASWLAESAYWLGTSQQTESGTNATASPIAFTATNSGNAPARVNLQIENTGVSLYSGATVTVRNTTTGKELRLFQMELDGGDTLRFDEDGQVYFEGAISAQSEVPKRIDGATFDLDPGANAIEIDHGFGSAGDITATIAWWERFHHLGSYV